MRTNPDFILREIAGEHILVPCGEAAKAINGLINLNGTAAFIWKSVDAAPDEETIIEQVKEHFEVEQETAEQDVHGLLRELRLLGMVLDD